MLEHIFEFLFLVNNSVFVHKRTVPFGTVSLFIAYVEC